MNNIDISQLIGQEESEMLEYKAVLPPSRNIAQLICSFANSNGGYIILGIDFVNSKIVAKGLSEDFYAPSITYKALDMLSPRPKVEFDYVIYQTKKIFVIRIEKSLELVHVENKVYIRQGVLTKLDSPPEIVFSKNGYNGIKSLSSRLNSFSINSTFSKSRFLDHYQGILNIFDGLGSILYPVKPEALTTIEEGKILSRVLFSSCVDNFETYLSDLLYEIYLAVPATLKSEQTVTIREVFSCADLQEFINYWAKQKIGKLQKGSVKGFIKDNKQISELNVITEVEQNDIEKILQIRHLYSHRNGIIDEKFLQYYISQFALNSEHQLTIIEICDKLSYLSEIVNNLDIDALKKYKLATV